MTSEVVEARLATQHDEEFLRELFIEIRAPEFAPAGLPPEQLAHLLTQQFVAMRTHYARFYPEAEYWILESAGIPIGYEAIREIEEFHLIDIALLAPHRNQGIGTGRLRRLMDVAASKGKSVTLSVEVFNPAKRLYERLGFREYEEFGVYKRMRWQAS